MKKHFLENTFYLLLENINYFFKKIKHDSKILGGLGEIFKI